MPRITVMQIGGRDHHLLEGMGKRIQRLCLHIAAHGADALPLAIARAGGFFGRDPVSVFVIHRGHRSGQCFAAVGADARFHALLGAGGRGRHGPLLEIVRLFDHDPEAAGGAVVEEADADQIGIPGQQPVRKQEIGVLSGVVV